MNISFEGSKPHPKIEPANLLRTNVIPYSETLELSPKPYTVAIFGQPVEDRTIYLLERRPGCDLGLHAFAKKLHKTGLILPDEVCLSTNIVSLVDFYEKHANKITSLDDIKFYREGIMSEIIKRMRNLGVKEDSLVYVDIAGSINFGLQTIGRFLADRQRKADTRIVKLSPLTYIDFLEEFELSRVLHLGLDPKFNPKEEIRHGTDHDFCFYDHKKSVEREIEYLASLSLESDIVLVIDCQVLASNYFQGTSVPFPFSFSISEIKALFQYIYRLKSRVKMIQICHFNPTVEDKRSAAFLLDFVYEFVCNLNN